MLDIFLLVAGLLLTAGTGIFVAVEFALVNLDRADLESQQSRGATGVKKTIQTLKQTSTQLSAAQLGITITTLLAGYCLEPAFSRFLQALAGVASLSWVSAAVLGPIIGVIAVAVSTILSMLFGELAPKNLAISRPQQVAKLVVPIQLAFTAIFKPMVLLLTTTSNGVLRLMHIEPQEELSSARNSSELASLVKRAAVQGSLDEDTALLLTNSLDFSELTAGDVMTPRRRISDLSVTDSVQDLVALAAKTGFSRFPVIGEDSDDIKGQAHLKAAMRVARDSRANTPILQIMVDLPRVPENMPLDALLGDLRSKSFQMAAVIDEYGGTAGIVTLEDLVEELIGEVADEHDQLRVGVVRSGNGWMLPGLIRPDEMQEQIGLQIPEDEDYDTLGGFLMLRLERMPVLGDVIVEPGLGAFTVTRMDGHRVDRVRFVPEQRASAASAGKPDESAGGDADV